MAPPAEQTVTLSGKTATVHAWGAVSLCDVDERKAYGDFDSMVELLLSFLSETSAGADGMWAPEHLATLQEAQKVLPPVLDSLEAAIAQSSKCQFAEPEPMAERLLRAEEFAHQARSRLREAPELLVWVKARATLNEFRDKLPAAQQSAREQWCPAKPTPVVDAYFAWEDETGKVEWLFCDGSKVVVVAGGKPELVLGDPKKAKKVQPKTYLDTATKFPAKEILRAPKLPEKKTAPARERDELDELGKPSTAAEP